MSVTPALRRSTGAMAVFLALALTALATPRAEAEAGVGDRDALPSMLTALAASAETRTIEATFESLLAATPDDAPDVDGDGVPDAVERILGINPELQDSDGDHLSDLYELESGFDPAALDSNNDGLPDNIEVDRAPDFDGDGVGNVWDDDNDGDGVRDGIDASPFARTELSDIYSLDVVTTGDPTYVDVQVRLSDEDLDLLSIEGSDWDWPYDPEGTIRDLVDVAGEDDVHIAPMLQFLADTGPDPTSIEQYGVVALEPNPWFGWPSDPESLDAWKALVPLAPVFDDGAKVALSGRVFIPGGANLSTAKMKLVWVVTGPFDTYSTTNFVVEWSPQQLENLKLLGLWPLQPGSRVVLQGDGDLPNPSGPRCTVEHITARENAFEFRCEKPLTRDARFEPGETVWFSSLGLFGLATISDAPVEEGSRIIARYPEEFVVTGIEGTAFQDVNVGMAFGSDSKEMFSAGLVLDYEFLRSQNTLAEAAEAIAAAGVESVSIVTPESLDVVDEGQTVGHFDQALATAAEHLLPHVLNTMPGPDRVAPVLTLLEERSVTRGPLEWTDGAPLQAGTTLTLDLSDTAYAATTKSMKLDWYDTTTRSEWIDMETAVRLATVGDGYVDELARWDLSDVALERLNLLTAIWMAGETQITEVGGNAISADYAEALDVMGSIEGHTVLAADGLALLAVLNGAVNNWQYLRALKPGIGLTNLAKVRAGLRNVYSVFASEAAPLKATGWSKSVRWMRGLGKVAVIAGIAIGFVSFLAIANSYGWSAEGVAMGLHSFNLYLITALVFEVLGGLSVFCGATAGAGCAAIAVVGAAAAAILGLVLLIDWAFGLGWWSAIEDWWMGLLGTETTPLVDLDLQFTDGPNLDFRDNDDNGFDVFDFWQLSADFTVEKSNAEGRTTAENIDRSTALPRFIAEDACYVRSDGTKICQPSPECTDTATGTWCFGTAASFMEGAWSGDAWSDETQSYLWYPSTMNDTTTYRTRCDTLLAAVPQGDEQSCRITESGSALLTVVVRQPSHDLTFDVSNRHKVVVALEHDPWYQDRWVTYETDWGGGSAETIHIDVLPGTFEEFLSWQTITALDTDRDGVDDAIDPDSLDPDYDGDGLEDGFEVMAGLDPLHGHNDADLLDDLEELRLGTDPALTDTDGDGLADNEEVDGWDIAFTYGGQSFWSHVVPDPLLSNSDGDGLGDAEERALGLNPLSPDTNGDGIPDSSNSPPSDLVIDSVPAVAEEGAVVVLEGGFTDVDDTDSHTMTVDWGDGTALHERALGDGERSFTASHTYADDSPIDGYPIVVEVTDAEGESTYAEMAVTVQNVAPTLEGLVGDEIDEGSVANLLGQFSDPGVEDSFTVTVNWRDGHTPDEIAYPAGTTTFELNHQYLDDKPSGTPSDTYQASVTVTDDDGGSTTETVAMVVNNVAPTLSIVAVADGWPFTPMGVEVEVTAVWGEVGVLDTLTGAIDWGDGTLSNLGDVMWGIAGTHVYDAAGVYTVAVTVTDDDTGTTTESVEVDIRDPAGSAEGVADQLMDMIDGQDEATQETLKAAIDSLIGEDGGVGRDGAADKFENENLVAALDKLLKAAGYLASLEGVDVSDQLLLLAESARSAAETEVAEVREEKGCVDLAADTCSRSERRKITAAEALIVEGKNAIQAGNYAEAIEAFKSAIQTS